MNVKDIPSHDAVDEKAESNIIMLRQIELENKYWMIEKREAPTYSINSHSGQRMIKDFLWRITEEIGEAMESWNNGEPVEKTYEEFADGLHFVVGLCHIVCFENTFQSAWEQIARGVKIHPSDSSRAQCVANFVLRAGLVGNTLKLKPWKQTDVLTDDLYFGGMLYDMVAQYLWVTQAYGMDHKMLFDYYWRKSEVNLFRIRSKY